MESVSLLRILSFTCPAELEPDAGIFYCQSAFSLQVRTLVNKNLLLENTRVALRPVEAGDSDFLCRVYASTREREMALVAWTAEQKTGFLLMQFNAQREHYLKYYPKAEYFVVERDGIAIGRLIVDRSKDPLFLADIAILPEYRNAGVGTAIIRDLMNEAASRNWSMSLYVEIFNPVIELYTRLGFVKVADEAAYHQLSWHQVTQNSYA